MTSPDAATVKRDPYKIPAVEFPWPPCPVCHDPLDHDGDWSCFNCGLEWDKSGQYGAFENPDAEPCGDDRQVERYSWSERMICQLEAGHDGPHSGFNPDKPGWPVEWWRWNDEGKQVL